jgi:hypothetical protein
MADWWLAELSQHGYASELLDGPHSDLQGVEQALYLYEQLGFARGRKFCAAKVEHFPVSARQHDTNQDALGACQEMIKATRTAP